MADVSPCPICKKDVARGAPTAPFCSVRCQTVDLGKWLSDEYRVPVDEAEGQEEAGVPTNSEENE